MIPRQEPVLVDALGLDFPVEGVGESVVGRLAWLGEVQRHAVAPGPKIEIPGDELGALIEPNAPRPSGYCCHSFEPSTASQPQ